MELPKLKKTLGIIIQKYKFVLLILSIGLIFVLLPTETQRKSDAVAGDSGNVAEHISQKELASILSRINGAGRVEVLLATETSATTDYQLNEDATSTSGGRLTTVTVTDSQRNEEGLIVRTGAPIYRGAIIVCDGADDSAVHLSVLRAVSNVTGLRTDQISVLKMK